MEPHCVDSSSNFNELFASKAKDRSLNKIFLLPLAGNRTRASRVAGENSTTEQPERFGGIPSVFIEEFYYQFTFICSLVFRWLYGVLQGQYLLSLCLNYTRRGY